MVLQAMRFGSVARWHAGPVVLALAVSVTTWCGWELGWTWVVAPDASVLDGAYRLGAEHHGWVSTWNVLCTVFSPVTFRLLTVGLIGYVLVRRPTSPPGRCAVPRTRIALFLFLSVELSGVVTETVKRLADRPRPERAMVDASGTSFPSGHALGSMVAVLALAVVLAPHLHRRLRPWAIAAGVLIVVLVGVGRIALNVHHPSDVVAGWALGYLYFAVCLPVLGRRTPVTGPGGTPATPDTAP